MASTAHGGLAEAAAAHLAKSANPVQSLSGSPTEIRRQGLDLAEWATASGLVLPDDFFADLEKHQEPTSEHEVYYRKSDNRAVKITRPGEYGYAVSSNGKHRHATPLLYLERLLLTNAVFLGDAVLEGVFLNRLNTYKDGNPKPSIVISQAWVDAEDEKEPHPSDEEIAEFMENLQFSRLPDCVSKWRRGGIIVSDARHHNFIKSADGLIPVDLLINLVDCDRPALSN